MAPVKEALGPMGKTFAIHEDLPPGGDLAALADLVERSGKTPEQAREALKALIEQIPDVDLKNFIGAQVSIVT